MTTVTRIDLKHGSRETRYVARLIWQELFNIYRSKGGNLNRMDSLLCDLGILEEATKKGLSPLSLFWEWGQNGWTDISSFASSPTCYHIEWKVGADEITITSPNLR